MTEEKKIPLMKPDMGEEELEAVREIFELKIKAKSRGIQIHNLEEEYLGGAKLYYDAK
jgi:dTDP-4-amino-4,6-dideoxygalactose transaminase